MSIEAYAAGLLDGEGCIHINRGKPACQLQVIFEMCDREPLDLLASRWGGTVGVRRNGTSTGRPIYGWTVNDSHALDFLVDIQVWIVGKALQVKAALSYPMFGKGLGKLPLDILEHRKAIGQELVDLKRPYGM